MDLISRQNAIEILQELENCIEYDVIGTYFDTEKAEQIINKLPSAQKTGKWLRRAWSIECSEFGCTAWEKTDYCAYCGARMENE